MKILIVEDNLPEIRILSKTLANILDEPPEILYATTLKKGMTLLNKHNGSLDLVFLDLKLPDSPDWQATYDAVADYATRVPIIVLSGNGDREIMREVLRNGAEDFIIKGSKKRNADRLRETIEFAVCRHDALKNLARTAEQDRECLQWLFGSYSVRN